MEINENEFNWVETGEKRLYPSEPDGNESELSGNR